MTTSCTRTRSTDRRGFASGGAFARVVLAVVALVALFSTTGAGRSALGLERGDVLVVPKVDATVGDDRVSPSRHNASQVSAAPSEREQSVTAVDPAGDVDDGVCNGW